MRRYAIVLVVLMLAASCSPKVAAPQTAPMADELFDFHKNGSSVFWAKVFHFPAEEGESVREWMRSAFGITEEKGDRIVGTYEGKLPFEEVGLTWGKAAVILQKPTAISFTAEFREGRMRVIVNDITFYFNTDVSTRAGMYSVTQSLPPASLNEVALKNGEWSRPFYKTSAAQLQQQLEYLFTPRKPNKFNVPDEW